MQGDPLGGGLTNNGTLTLTNSTFNNNSSTFSAGGILNGNLGTATLTNVTLDTNSAGNGGGGFENGGTATLTNVTLSDNFAGQGSSIRTFGGTATLKNTILATFPGGGNCSLLAGTIVSAGSNLSTDNTCAAFFTAGGDYNNTDPLLGSLLLNPPGSTATRALTLGSPAIDAVLNPCPPPATDQRGVSRPHGPRCDIGAFEFNPAAAAPGATRRPPPPPGPPPGVPPGPPPPRGR